MKEILKMRCQIYINDESDNPEENTSDSEDFRSTIFQPFQFEPEQKNARGNENHKK